MNTQNIFARSHYTTNKLAEWMQVPALVFARIYVALIFFRSGLTKVQDWDTTLFLFEEEYSVPLLNPELSAYLATAGELILPVLLIVGLFTRFSALGLMVINIVAVLSLDDIAAAAMGLHVIWGLLLAMNILWGASAISVDHIIRRKVFGIHGSNKLGA